MTEHNTMTVGIDIGDKTSHICVLDYSEGEFDVLERTQIRTTKKHVSNYFSQKEPMVVAMEVGTHSPWMSKEIEQHGHTVLVANSRKLRFIYDNDQKNDKVDAELLARVARMDPRLLYPIKHRGERHAQAMAVIRTRDALVRARTLLVNSVRGTVKSSGSRLPSCDTGRFHKLFDQIPEALQPKLAGTMSAIENLNQQIKELDREIDRLCEQEFPETEALQQVAGVGPITALTFVLVFFDLGLFPNNRSAGPYLGLVRRTKQSGDKDPEGKISKAGNEDLRRLLVSCANYILGPFGPDCDLRRHGQKIADGGGKNAKKRAKVAVARKLSVLLLALLKTGEEYEPLRNANQIEKKVA